jgi:hypothetical protein
MNIWINAIFSDIDIKYHVIVTMKITRRFLIIRNAAICLAFLSVVSCLAK